MILSSSSPNSGNILIDLSVILLVGFFFGIIFQKLKIPAVSGYLIGGLIIGPAVLNLVSQESLDSFEIISSVALGFIAFQIGTELWLGKIKNSGKSIIIITTFQVLITLSVVTFALSFFTELWLALILGAIATATAPAPIIMICKKFKTKGTLTDTILPVTGLDDAFGILVFGISLSIAHGLYASTGNINILHALAEPLRELLVSILVGTIVGIISGFTISKIDRNNEQSEKQLDITVIVVLLTVGVAILFHLSPILVPLISGAIVTNMCNKDIFEVEEYAISKFIPPLMIAFFTIAGAQLNLNSFVNITVLVLTSLYIIFRIIGKVFGAYLGGVVANAPENVKKYLGASLLPQSGVAIGFVYTAKSVIMGDDFVLLESIILSSVVFFGLVGPLLVKRSLDKCNEVTYEPE